MAGAQDKENVPKSHVVECVVMRDETMTQDKESMQVENSELNLQDTTIASTAIVSASNGVDQSSVFIDFKNSHPSLFLSRQLTTEVER